jgi:hypothetical protein
MKFEDLPDEIVSSILALLDFKEVARFARTSKRNREIGLDNNLWFVIAFFPVSLVG